MDAPAFPGRLDGGGGCIDVLGHTARQAADHRTFDFAGNLLHGREIAFADDGKSGFDDVDAEPRQLAGDFQFFTLVHGSARALFAVAQRCVEYDDFVAHKFSAFWRRIRRRPSPPEKTKTPPPFWQWGF